MIKYSLLKNLILVISVHIYALIRGTAKGEPKIPPEKVVIMFLTTNIGDMIFATPIFRALKVKYPQTKLTVVGSAKNKIILEGNKDVDDYVVCKDSIWELIKNLRAVGADYGATVSSSSLDASMMFLAGIPSVAVFSVENADTHTRSYRAIQNLFIQIPYFIGKYVAQEYLRILSPLEIKSEETKKHLYFTNEGKNSVEKFFLDNNFDFKNRKLAIISPGAGTKIKQWPAERFAEVADYLYEKYNMGIAVIGGPGDREETDLFVKSLKKIQPLIYVDSSLDELKAFISYGHVLMANDSGPVYIAEAFDVATLVVVGPTDENEHPPQGERNRIVTCEDRGEAELKGHLEGFDESVAERQIKSVETGAVLAEAEDLLYTLNS